MSTTSAPQRRSAHAPPSAPTLPLQLTITAARTSLADRIAMRLGLWLIIWSTRAPRPDDHAEHTRRRANAIARAERERAALHRALTAPRGI